VCPHFLIIHLLHDDGGLLILQNGFFIWNHSLTILEATFVSPSTVLFHLLAPPELDNTSYNKLISNKTSSSNKVLTVYDS
jgi:hypothetical protein